MRNLLAVILVALLACVVLVSPAFSQDFIEDPQLPTKLAQKHPTAPGPIIPPLPEPPGFSKTPRVNNVTRENRLYQPITASAEGGIEAVTAIVAPEDLESTGAILSMTRRGGTARSSEQDARRSIKRLIRKLGG